MSSFDDDLDDLMRVCMDVFTNCTAQLVKDGNPLEPAFSGVFDQNHVSVKLENDREVSTTSPVLKVHKKDFPATAEIGDGVIMGDSGTRYEIWDVQPDSGFEILLFLHEED